MPLDVTFETGRIGAISTTKAKATRKTRLYGKQIPPQYEFRNQGADVNFSSLWLGTFNMVLVDTGSNFFELRYYYAPGTFEVLARWDFNGCGFTTLTKLLEVQITSEGEITGQVREKCRVIDQWDNTQQIFLPFCKAGEVTASGKLSWQVNFLNACGSLVSGSNSGDRTKTAVSSQDFSYVPAIDVSDISFLLPEYSGDNVHIEQYYMGAGIIGINGSGTLNSTFGAVDWTASGSSGIWDISLTHSGSTQFNASAYPAGPFLQTAVTFDLKAFAPGSSISGKYKAGLFGQSVPPFTETPGGAEIILPMSVLVNFGKPTAPNLDGGVISVPGAFIEKKVTFETDKYFGANGYPAQPAFLPPKIIPPSDAYSEASEGGTIPMLTPDTNGQGFEAIELKIPQTTINLTIPTATNWNMKVWQGFTGEGQTSGTASDTADGVRFDANGATAKTYANAVTGTTYKVQHFRRCIVTMRASGAMEVFFGFNPSSSPGYNVSPHKRWKVNIIDSTFREYEIDICSRPKGYDYPYSTSNTGGYGASQTHTGIDNINRILLEFPNSGWVEIKAIRFDVTEVKGRVNRPQVYALPGNYPFLGHAEGKDILRYQSTPTQTLLQVADNWKNNYPMTVTGIGTHVAYNENLSYKHLAFRMATGTLQGEGDVIAGWKPKCNFKVDYYLTLFPGFGSGGNPFGGAVTIPCWHEVGFIPSALLVNATLGSDVLYRDYLKTWQILMETDPNDRVFDVTNAPPVPYAYSDQPANAYVLESVDVALGEVLFSGWGQPGTSPPYGKVFWMGTDAPPPPPSGEKSLAMTKDDIGTHFIAYTVGETIKLWRTNFRLGLSENYDVLTETGAENPAICWDKTRERLALAYDNGTDIKITYNYARGSETFWDTAVVIAQGKFPALTIDNKTGMLFIALHNGAKFVLYRQPRPDATLEGPFDIVTIAEGPIAIEMRDPVEDRGIVAVYRDSNGDLKTLFSYDYGETWG